MANDLKADKQAVVIGALAEGSSIRSIERMSCIHRDTIMQLVISVAAACEHLLDEKLQLLDCHRIQVEEIWGCIGKKQKHAKAQHNPQLVGDVWTFVRTSDMATPNRNHPFGKPARISSGLRFSARYLKARVASSKQPVKRFYMLRQLESLISDRALIRKVMGQQPSRTSEAARIVGVSRNASSFDTKCRRQRMQDTTTNITF